jgi:hypothetical protein
MKRVTTLSNNSELASDYGKRASPDKRTYSKNKKLASAAGRLSRRGYKLIKKTPSKLTYINNSTGKVEIIKNVTQSKEADPGAA